MLLQGLMVLFLPFDILYWLVLSWEPSGQEEQGVVEAIPFLESWNQECKVVFYFTESPVLYLFHNVISRRVYVMLSLYLLIYQSRAQQKLNDSTKIVDKPSWESWAGLREPMRDGEVPRDLQWWGPSILLILMEQGKEKYLERELQL